MRKLERFNLDNEDSGFTLIELAVVVFVLGTLGSIAIPNIVNQIKLNRIEEAKALLNSYAADCLSQYRVASTAEEFSKVKPSSASTERFTNLGYSITKDKDKCTHFSIAPSDEKENVLFSMDFRVNHTTGRVLKTAMPATNSASFNSCKGWAGSNCGASDEQKAKWAEEERIQALYVACENLWKDAIESKKSGPVNIWREAPVNECGGGVDGVTYFFEGRNVGTPEGYDQALSDKYGRLCKDWRDEQVEKKTTGGPLTKTECGTEEFYYFAGTPTTADGLIALERERDIAKCEADKEKARVNNHKGLYQGVKGPDPCGQDVWMCNGRIVPDNDAYLLTSCGATPPPPTPPPGIGKPPPITEPVPPPGKPPSYCKVPRDMCRGVMMNILPNCQCWKNSF